MEWSLGGPLSEIYPMTEKMTECKHRLVTSLCSGVMSFVHYIIVVVLLMILFLVFNATFNNISAISWRPVLVVGEAGENHRPWASNW